MTVRLDEQALGEYVDRFERDAFRHESLPAYDVASDGDGYARWLAGDPPDPEISADWTGWIRAQRARGARVRRLRTLVGPPSDYVRFEAEVFYTVNAAAGEEIRVLDLTERNAPPGPVTDEYWMLDGARVAFMHYLPDGRFSHAEAVEGAAASAVVRARDVAWAAAEPFADWWSRHPEYHRGAGVS